MNTADSSVTRKLSSSRKPYVYWISPVEIDSIGHAAVALAFGIWHVDARMMTDAEAVFRIFGQMFKFEELFGPRWGRNWDALIDGLRELDRTEFKGYVLVVENAENLWRSDPTLYYKFIDTMGAVSEYWDEWKDARIAFKTVLVAESEELRRVVTHRLD